MGMMHDDDNDHRPSVDDDGSSSTDDASLWVKPTKGKIERRKTPCQPPTGERSSLLVDTVLDVRRNLYKLNKSLDSDYQYALKMDLRRDRWFNSWLD